MAVSVTCRCWPRCGAHATAVDVDPLLPEIYKDASGAFGSGSVQLLHGRFPFETTLVEDAGTGYDLVVSKNTLKRGYIHPSRTPTSPRHVIDLGVDDEIFLAAIAKLLKTQGLFVIYNFCPPKAAEDKPYIPWAEGESPFTQEQFVAAASKCWNSIKWMIKQLENWPRPFDGIRRRNEARLRSLRLVYRGPAKVILDLTTLASAFTECQLYAIDNACSRNIVVDATTAIAEPNEMINQREEGNEAEQPEKPISQ